MLTADRELKSRVHRRLVDAHDTGALEPLPLRHRLAELMWAEAPLLPSERASALVEELVHEVAGLGPLEPVLADGSVTEVMLNGPGRAWVERHGRIAPLALDLDAPALLRLVERVVAPLGLRCDRTAPVVDARLPDGSRFHAVVPPLAVDGPYVTIRRFGARAVPLAGFGADDELSALLRRAVVEGRNLLVAGGTSSGKTTLLNALASFVPAQERVVTIEETAELRLAHPHVVRLEARPANAEGVGAVSVRDLVRAALRMRPDRIVVGEVRGGEALDLLEALNTGHDGSLSTVHANGPAEALARLEALALRGASRLPARVVRRQVTSSIHAVVHVERRGDGSRSVLSVAEVRPGGGPGLAVAPLWSAR